MYSFKDLALLNISDRKLILPPFFNANNKSIGFLALIHTLTIVIMATKHEGIILRVKRS